MKLIYFAMVGGWRGGVVATVRRPNAETHNYF